MRALFRFWAIATWALTACNYNVGECWIDGQGGGDTGAGGAVIVPGGPGGYGDVPPEPQGAGDPSPPDCNIVADTPCNERCLANYETAATACGKLESDSDRQTCQSAAYVAYMTCRASCHEAATECEDKCYDAYDADHKKRDKMPDGPGKAKCRQAAGENLANCIKNCKNK